MIWLDGIGYHIEKTGHSLVPTAYASSYIGLTGQLNVLETGLYANRYQLRLSVSQVEYDLLRASFIKCHSTSVFLNFVDARELNWNPSAGVNDASHRYSTGVWFESLGPAIPTEQLFDPVTQAAKDPLKRFVADIILRVNATELA